MSTEDNVTPIRAGDLPTAPEGYRLITKNALMEVDNRLKQIRAIADLLSAADTDVLYDNTIDWSMNLICVLSEEASTIVE